MKPGPLQNGFVEAKSLNDEIQALRRETSRKVTDRNRIIRNLFNSGMSVETIAEQTGMESARVDIILMHPGRARR